MGAKYVGFFQFNGKWEGKDMIGSKRVIAIIPARGGSKGIPGKNIKVFFGKPLIAWTIESAKGSRYIDSVVVSTDNDDIARISKTLGAEVPFKRPAEIAKDDSSVMDAITHCLDWLESTDQIYDIVVLLQPTSPLRVCTDIDGAIESLVKRGADAIVSVSECDHPPEWTGKLPEDLNMKDFIDKNVKGRNRQDLDVSYRINGCIFVSDTGHIRRFKDWYGPMTFAYITSKDSSIDIDNDLDFKLAELILSNRETP